MSAPMLKQLQKLADLAQDELDIVHQKVQQAHDEQRGVDVHAVAVRVQSLAKRVARVRPRCPLHCSAFIVCVRHGRE